MSIYLVRSNRLNAFKIGRSSAPIKRLRDIRTGCPDAVLLATYDGDSKFESFLHKRLRSIRVGGEWFAYPGRDELVISAVESLARQYTYDDDLTEFFTEAAKRL